MESIIFNNEEKTITIKKDCLKCQHIHICKFHENIKNVASQDIMYQMSEYTKDQNILRTFELYSYCKYYTLKYKHKAKGESPTIDTDEVIIKHIIYQKIEDIKKQLLNTYYPKHSDNMFFFWQPDVVINIQEDIFTLVLKTTNKEIGHGTIVHDDSYKISEILTDWKYAN